MKGLLKKELYLLFSTGGLLVVVILLFALMGAADEAGMSSFFSIFALIYAPFATYTLFSYEEKWRWTPYVLCAPVTRFQVVLAKYLMTLGILLATAAVYAAASLAFQNPVWQETLLSGLTIAFGMGAVSLPLMFRLGTEKARAVSIVLCMLLGIIMGAIAGLADAVGETEAITGHISPLAPVIAFAVFAASCPLSAWLFKRRK